MPEDKMGHDIRKRLKEIGTVGGRYATSTAKLFLASGKEMFSLKMPTLTSMVGTNKELLDDTARFLRSPVDTINKSINRAMDTDDAKAIMKFAKNALEDLKTGNLYDVDRDRNSATSAISDMLNEFGGFDMSGFDENGEWSEPTSEDPSIEASAAIADIQEENASKRTVATINAIGTSTNAITGTMNANAQADIRLSIKQHAQMMGAMSNMITVQAASIQALDTTAKSALEVARESHTQIMGQMEKMTTLLEEIRDGVRPKQERINYKEKEGPFGARGELDIKKYFNQVIKNIDDRYGVGSKATAMMGGMGAKDLLELVGDNPWQLVAQLALGRIVPESLQRQMEKTDRNLKNFFPALFDKLASKGSQTGPGGERGLIDELFSVLGVRQRSKTSIDTAVRNVNSQAVFTTKFTTTVEQVIPMLLSKIASNISGEPIQVYDHSRGKFVNATAVASKYYHQANDLVGGMSSAQDFIDMAGEFNWKTRKDRDDFQKYLYQYFQHKGNSGSDNFINPFMESEKFKETMPESDKKDFYYNLMQGMFKAMPRETLMQMSGDIYEARDSRDRRNATINQELRDTGLISAFSGILDENLLNSIEYATKKERIGLSSDALDNLVADKRAQALKRGGVQASNIILNEILGTLRKGIITYSYNIGTMHGDEVQSVLKDVLDASTKQKDLESKILSRKNDVRLRSIRRTEEEARDSVNAQRDKIPELADTLITSDIDADTAALIMGNIRTRRTAKNESDNSLVEWIRRHSENLSGSASDVLDQTGVKGTFERIKKIASSPFAFMDEALRTVDAFMFKMIYGEDASVLLENGGEPSLMRSVTQAVKVQFLHAKDWFKANIGDPIKKFLFDKDKGLMPRIGSALATYAKPYTDKIKSKAVDVRDKTMSKLIGTKDEETGKRSGGVFSSTINKVTDMNNGMEGRITSAIDRMLYGDFAHSERKGVGSDAMVVDADGNITRAAGGKKYGGVIGKLRQGFDKTKEYLFGPDGERNDSKKKFNLIKTEVNKALPDMTIGAGLGIIGSFFLPGGPLLGALLGSTAGFVKSSEKFKEYLFGESDERTEIDPVTGKTRTVKTRKGNLISQEVYDGLKKYVPGVSKGAMIGAAMGGLGLLPFGMGPMIGAVFGSIGGMSAASDQIKEMIFGNYEDPKSGLISKEFREKVKSQIKRVAPSALGGAAIGAGAWGAISSLGIIPGLSLIPGGPIFGMLGAITGAVNADSLNKFFFGDEVETEEEIKDKDGKVTGTKKKKKREGGVFGKVFDTVRDSVVSPFAKRVDAVGKNIGSWFQESIIGPLGRSMQPLKDNMGKAGTAIKDSLANIGAKITDGINRVFEINIGMPLGDAFKKLLKPLDDMAKRIFGAIGTVIGAIISAPFKALEVIVTGSTGGSPEERSAKRDARYQRRSERRQKWKDKRKARRDKRMAKRMGNLSDSAGQAGNGIRGFFGRFFNRNTSDAEMNAVEAVASGSDMVANITGTSIGGIDTVYSGQSDEHDYSSPDFYGVGADYDRESNAADGGTQRSSDRTNAEKKVGFWENARQKKIQKQDAKDQKRKERQERTLARYQDKTQRKKAILEARRERMELKAIEKANTGTENDKKNRKPLKKTDSEYLADIAKYSKKTFDELKGQVNGVGWNTAYIKSLLEKQYGFGLSDEELPEEMEGSKRTIRKRRGILGKIKDKASDLFGSAKDKLFAIGSAIKDKFGFIINPIMMFVDAIGTAKEAVLSFGSTVWDLIKNAASAIAGAVKGAVHLVGDALFSVTGFIKGAAKGFGSAIGDAFSLVTGVLSDAGLALSGVVAGLVDVAAEVAPDIARGVWSGMKFVGRTVTKGVVGAARFAGKGLKWLFGKVTGIGGDDVEQAKTKIKKIGTFEVKGGYLDEIKDGVTINLGGKITPVPFPYVNVARGKIINKSSSAAIPVFVMGADTSATIRTKTVSGKSATDDMLSGKPESGRSSNSNDEKSNAADAANKTSQGKRRTFLRWMHTYHATDRSAESATDSAQAYDRAMKSAQSMEDVEAIQAAQQLNANNALTAIQSGEGGEKDGSSLLDMLGVKAAPVIKSVLGAASVAIPALFHFGSDKGNKAWGAENLGITALRRLGINKLSPAQIAEYVTNPAAAATAGREAAEAGTRAGVRTARGIGRLGNLGNMIEWIRNPAAADAAVSASRTMGTSSLMPRVMGTIGKAGASVVSGAKNIVGKVGGFVGDLIGKPPVNNLGQLALGSADDVAKTGPVKAAISKVLKSLLNNKTVVNLFGKLKTKIPSLITKLTTFISGEVLEKAMKSSAMATVKSTAKQIATFATGGILAVGFLIYDFISGMGNSAKYFGVYGDDVTLSMRLTSAVCNSLGGLLSLIPVVGGALSIAAALLMNKIVTLVHGCLFGEDAKNDVTKKQNELKAATTAYNAQNGTNLSPEEYAKQFNKDGTENKPWYKKAGDTIAGAASSAWSGIKNFGSNLGNYFFNGGWNSSNPNWHSPDASGSGWGTGIRAMSQRNSRYNRGNKNMALAGCGPTAASIVASAYGKNLNPEMLSNLAYGMGMRAADGGTNPAFFNQTANMFGSGFGMKQGPVDARAIEANLGKGQPVIMMGKGGPYGSHMHYMVAEGTTGRGKMQVVDPMTGARKQVGRNALVGNASSTIYSYGKGAWGRGPVSKGIKPTRHGAAVASKESSKESDATDSVATAQNALVEKMNSIYGQIPYSLSGPQDPDKGSASCASTVGWAYRKTLGVDGMSASSTAQSKDSRFTTIWTNDGKNLPDLTQLAPGDIFYQNWGQTKNNDSMKHTEMYVGDGKTLSHGGSGKGPVFKDLLESNSYRLKHTMKIRRYNGFLDGSTPQIASGFYDQTQVSGDSTDSADGSANPMDAIGNFFGAIGTKLDNLLAPFLGMTPAEETGETTTTANANEGVMAAVGKTKKGKDASAGTNKYGNIPRVGGVAGTNKYGNIPRVSGADAAGSNAGQKVWNFLVENGLSKEAAAGIMGNLYAESHVDPKQVENWYNTQFGKTDEEFTKGVDDGTITKEQFLKTPTNPAKNFGYGLAQWTWPSRKEGLYNLAKAKGTSIGDVGTQLDYLWQELNGSSFKSTVLDPIQSAKSIKDASTIVLKNFENPSNADAQIDTRAQYAQTMYDTYGSGWGLGSSPIQFFGEKAKKAVFPLSYGTGAAPDANLSALNDRIRKVNNLIANTRNESTGSPADQVVSKMTDALSNATSTNPETAELMKVIVTSMSTMVSVLKNIEKNTQPTVDVPASSGQSSGKSKYRDLPIAQANQSNSDDNGYDTGARIIDRLTSK